MENRQTLEDYTKSLRVLLVEDNDEAREAFYDLLSNYFDNITTAVDGEDGFKKLTEREFDLLITDINIPKMNGLEMIRRLRELESDIPIIVLTAYQEIDYLMNSIKCSIDAYLLKPVNFQELHKAIHKITKNLYSFYKNRMYEKHLENLVTQKTKELIELSNRDPMTNLYNRRYFNEVSQTLLKLSKREKRNLSVLMLDIDRFKVVNDNYGHLFGDIVLKEVAALLQKTTRESDVVIRFGGEEFVILLPSTNLEGAVSIAQKIRIGIESLALTTDSNEVIKFTISVGIALCDCLNDTNIDSLIHRSDEALYEAKRAGRNQVVVYEKESF